MKDYFIATYFMPFILCNADDMKNKWPDRQFKNLHEEKKENRDSFAHIT